MHFKKFTLTITTISLLLLLFIASCNIFNMDNTKKCMPTYQYQFEIPLNDETLQKIFFDAIYYKRKNVSVNFSKYQGFIVRKPFKYAADKVKKQNKYSDILIKKVTYLTKQTNKYLTVDFNFEFNEDELKFYNKAPLKDDLELYDEFCKNINNEKYTFFIKTTDNLYKSMVTEFILKTAVNNNLLWQEPKFHSIEQLYKDILVIDIIFDKDTKNLKERHDELYKYANNIINSDSFKKLKNQREQIKYIHNIVMDSMEYDKDLQAKINNYNMTFQDHIQNSAYGGFFIGKTACTGYAQAIKILCDLAKIKCTTVSGSLNGESHIWNKVQIDGEDYYLDATISDNDELPPYNDFLFTELNYREQLYKIGRKSYKPF